MIRILHIVENLNTGAVENWLVRILRSVDPKQYSWTFFSALGREGRLDNSVRELGGEVLYSPHEIGNKRVFMLNLRKVIKEGTFDVLHCHHDFVSALYLFAAMGLPVKKRIVHVHNTDEGILTPSALKQFLFREPMRQTCLRLADNVVGISQEALARFTRSSRVNPKRDRVIYYGIDTSPFRRPIGSAEQFRFDLGLAPNAQVLLFVGRMVPLKNPCFVIDVLSELVQRNSNAVALFVGNGELEEVVRSSACARNLEDRIRVLGWRDDTAAIMRHCDLLIFPRLEEPKEGLGLVLVEAQAAGLPILASPSITKDVQVVPELFYFLPLSTGAKAWAHAAQTILQQEPMSKRKALSIVEESPFSLEAGVSSLLSLYADLN